MFDTKFSPSGGSFKVKFSSSKNDFDSEFNSYQVLKGEDGFSPIVDIQKKENGYTIDITDKEGKESFEITNGIDGYTPIKGVDYFDGIDGKDGTDGRDGVDGKDGVDGYTPIKGVDYFDGKDGVNGIDGVDGKDGYTPIKGVDYFDGTNGRDGIDGKDGYTPIKGKDYFTEEDVQEIVGKVTEEMPTPVTSWNDLTDKPFGETPPAFDIQWDGDMTGRETFLLEENAYLVKVSDEVFTKEQLLNSTMYYSVGNDYTLIEEDIFVYNDIGFIDLGGDVSVVFSAELLISAMGLPEGSVSNGVWFINWIGKEPYYINRFIASSAIKKLDNKYLDLDDYAKAEDLEGFAKTEDLSDVAKSGSYNHLIDKPNIPTSYNELEDRPNLAQIATSGSWNDLEDKPFGVGETSWVLIASGQAAGTDNSISLLAKLVEGKNYKLEVVQGLINVVLASNIAPCVTTSLNWYTIGNNQDAVWCEAFGGTLMVRWNVSSPYGYTVNIYEESEVITTLDEKFLPESVVLESELEGKGYQTKEQVKTLIDEAAAEGGDSVISWNELTDKPDFAPIATSGSWNDLVDKPFEEEIIEETLEFDGDLTGREYYEGGAGSGAFAVKMADASPTIEELLGATITVKYNASFLGANNGEEVVASFICNEENIEVEKIDESNYLIIVVFAQTAPALFIIHGDLSSVGFFPEGTYFLYQQLDEEYFYTHLLSYTKKVVHKIEEKYLPESAVLESEIEPMVKDAIEQAVLSGEFNGADGFSPVVSVTGIEGGHKVTITDKEGEKTFDVMDGKDVQGGGGGVTSWNDLTGKPFGEQEDYIELWAETSFNSSSYKIMPAPSIAFKEGDICRYTYDNSVYETQIIKHPDSEGGYWLIGGNPYVVIGSLPDNGQPVAFHYYSRNKTYFVEARSKTSGIHTFSAGKLETVTKPLDEKYIPDTIARSSEIPSLNGYATEQYVDDAIANIEISGGSDGKDGISATHSWNGTVLTITSASGTSSADLKGEKGDDGYTPIKGTDYFTAADKNELVDAVLAVLPIAEEVKF